MCAETRSHRKVPRETQIGRRGPTRQFVGLLPSEGIWRKKNRRKQTVTVAEKHKAQKVPLIHTHTHTTAGSEGVKKRG